MDYGFDSKYAFAFGIDLEGELAEVELEHRKVIHRSLYRGERLKTGYRPDFICYSTLIVELKALRALSSIDEALAINYLKASKLTKALLLNFGAPSLQFRRFVFNLRESAKSAD